MLLHRFSVISGFVNTLDRPHVWIHQVSTFRQCVELGYLTQVRIKKCATLYCLARNRAFAYCRGEQWGGRAINQSYTHRERLEPTHSGQGYTGVHRGTQGYACIADGKKRERLLLNQIEVTPTWNPTVYVSQRTGVHSSTHALQMGKKGNACYWKSNRSYTHSALSQRGHGYTWYDTVLRRNQHITYIWRKTQKLTQIPIFLSVGKSQCVAYSTL